MVGFVKSTAVGIVKAISQRLQKSCQSEKLTATKWNSEIAVDYSNLRGQCFSFGNCYGFETLIPGVTVPC